jgi:hypothetical protein
MPFRIALLQGPHRGAVFARWDESRAGAQSKDLLFRVMWQAVGPNSRSLDCARDDTWKSGRPRAGGPSSGIFILQFF